MTRNRIVDAAVERRGPGRPRNRVQSDPGRFRLALHRTLIQIFGYREYSAARTAVAALGGVAIVASGAALSALRDDDGNSVLAGRADALVRRYREILSRATRDELDWLERSCAGLMLLIVNMGCGDAPGCDRAVASLAAIDPQWPSMVAKLEDQLRSIVVIELARLDEDRLPRRGALFRALARGQQRIMPDFGAKDDK